MFVDRPSDILLADVGNNLKDRIGYLAVMVSSAAVLGMARWVTPSPTGVGTHEQLGLPVCMFLKLTGIPCSSCGLTTSVAHAVRFEFAAALTVQPFGLLIAALAVALIPAAFFLMVRRTTLETVLRDRSSRVLTYGIVAAYALAWFYKIWSMQVQS